MSRPAGLSGLIAALIVFSVGITSAQQPPVRAKQYSPGSWTDTSDLPASPLKSRIEGLPTAAKAKALGELRAFHFTELDLKSLRPDATGALFYEDAFQLPPQASEKETNSTSVAKAAGDLAVSPFPGSLIFHSRPGAPNVLFLNFSGETVTGTAWNTSVGRDPIPAVAFSTDSDFSNFSTSEQSAIKAIWERVSEDYAPFNIDVTTERPVTFGTRVAHALITRNTDANTNDNPSSTAGGVAYVNKFATSSYATYRPAWIYFNKLANNASYIAEAVSHEIGHNMGLSHDGQTGSSSDYYGGHGSGDISWGPIMGTGYGQNVSQWSKGEYYLANNTQDDLATIAAKITYRADDHGDTDATATALTMTGVTNIVSTTPESDPTNLNPSNKGVLDRNTDVDVFSFVTGNGTVRLTVNPWIMPSGTRGGNLDVLLELYDSTGTLRATNNPAAQTTAQIQMTLSAGKYYLHIRSTGVGDPMSSTPSGYTSYASIGQYFISGYIAVPTSPPAQVQLVANVNNPAWGNVSPSNATYAAGSPVQVVATASPYYRFTTWTNGIVSGANPLSFSISSNTTVKAMFTEILTTNHPTPWSWLASVGYTNNFETAITRIGTNGLPLWQSFIAGLNPNNPNDRLQLSMTHRTNGSGDVLSWNTVTGRLYTISCSGAPAGGFTNLPGAVDLAATSRSYTNTINPNSLQSFYRLSVRKP